MKGHEEAFNPVLVLDAAGRPMPRHRDSKCPRCSADADKRVASSGFGSPHDVCGGCGYEFQELTR